MEFVLFVACIVLAALLGNKSSKLRDAQKILEEKERILSEYRAQNKALQNALREARKQNVPSSAENNEANATGEEQVQMAAVEGSEEKRVQMAAVENTEEKQVQVADSESIAENGVQADLTAYSVDEKPSETSVQLNRAGKPIPHSANRVRKKEQKPVVREKKERKPISSGVMMFGIGILLVLTAGAIFATTSWKILPAVGKVAVLLGTVAVFYGSAFIAEKKLSLRNTSITFFILGSAFLSVSNLAAGYFGMYGFYEDQKMLVWAVSFLIAALCMIVGRVIYKTRFFALLGYCFILTSVFAFAGHFCSNPVEIAAIMGVALLATKAYTVFVEKRFEDRPIEKSLVVFRYVYAVATLIIAFAYENNIFTGEATPMSLRVTLWLMVAINLALALWCTYNRENIRNSDIVFSCISIVAVGLADRGFEYISIRLLISLVILMLTEVALIFARKLAAYRTVYSKIVTSFAEVVTGIAAIGFIINGSANKSIVWSVALLVVALLQYVLHHFEQDNVLAFISASSLFIGIGQLLYIGTVDDHAAVGLTILLIIAIAATFAGRFIYKSLAVKNENGIHIDWITICAFILLAYATAIAQEFVSDAPMFITALVFSAYLACYYGRCGKMADRIFLTLAISTATFFVGEQPFVDIPKEFTAEWWIAINLIGTGIVSIVWREYSRYYRYVWMVAVATAFLGEFFSIQDYSYRNDNVIGTLKLVIYLAGVIALFVMSYVKQSKRFLIETGFAFALFSMLAWSFEAKGIFILAALFGLAYLVYLHIKGMSMWAFLPLIQLYVVLGALDMPNWAWLIVFAVAILAGYLLHRLWDSEAKKSFADDWINISAIIPVLAIWSDWSEKWVFCAEMMLVVYLLSFYRRYVEDRNSMVNKALLTAASVVLLIAWVTEPWFRRPDLWTTEWSIVGFMAMCIFNMVVVYKHTTHETWGWITFASAIICILIQAQQAVSDGHVTDALVLGIVMLVVLVWAYLTRKKQWFILAGVTLIAQSIYASREFWKSIAWWVYLLVAGAVLIIIAARSEYKKRQADETVEPERRHMFQDWTL